MALNSDDQEQLETLKNWWKNNGKALVLGGVLALVGFGGFQGYTSYQQSQAETASGLYSELSQLLVNPQSNQLSAEAKLSASELIKRLTEDFSGSIYADYAHLFAARLAVEEDQLSQAKTHLEAALSNTKVESLGLIARLRLARILTAEDKTQEALKLLNVASAGSFTAEFETLKGDLFISQGETELARQAYQKALDANQARGDNPPLLELKLDNLPGDEEV